MVPSPEPCPDIYIVGTGIKSGDQLTQETLVALQASREVLFVDPAVGTRACLERYCSEVTSLYEESYRTDQQRLHGYRHMAIRVVEAALKHAPVTFAMHGHPVVFSEAPLLIHKMASALDLSVKVIPGVSAMDCLFADLLVDPGGSGVLMYEATDLLLRRRTLLPEVPTLIWQVGNLETRLHSRRISRPERFDRFVAYLSSAYPLDHAVTAYYASPHCFAPATILTFPLRELRDHAAELHPGVTLFLTAVREQAVLDRDLLQAMDSPEHLDRMTR